MGHGLDSRDEKIIIVYGSGRYVLKRCFGYTSEFLIENVEYE